MQKCGSLFSVLVIANSVLIEKDANSKMRIGRPSLVGAAPGFTGNIPVILLSNANLIVNLLARRLTAAINDNYIVTNLRENRVNW